MNKILSHINSNIAAFFISLIYVAIGTIAVCSIAGRDTLHGEWSLYALILTFPVSIVSFGYRFAETDYLIPVLIIQSVMFVLCYLLLARFIKRNAKQKTEN